MRNLMKSVFLMVVLAIFLHSCLSEKNPIAEIPRAFPEKVSVPLSDLDGKFWYAILNGQPIESGKYFVNCFDFRDIEAGELAWASSIYTPRKDDVEITDKEYVPVDGVKNDKIKVYFDTKEVDGEKMIVSNYFIVYIEVDGDYFDTKENWGGERISRFIFPKKDFEKQGETFAKKTISQLVVFEDYEKKGEKATLKLNFAQSVYVDDFSGVTPEEKLKKMKETLISRNESFIRSGGIFESLWVRHHFVDADDELLAQWKVKSSTIGKVKREYNCGHVYDRNGERVSFYEGN